MKKSYLIGLAVGLVAIALLIVMWPRGGSLEDAQESQIVEPAYQEETDQDLEDEDKEEQNLPAMTHAEASVSKPSSTLLASSPKTARIEKLVNSSRVYDEFRAMDELLDMQFDQLLSMPDLTPAEQEELEKLRNAVSGEKMMEQYKQVMNEKFSEQELAQLQEIYEKPVVSEAAEREVYFQSQDGQKELMEHWKNFKPESVNPERRKLVEAYSKPNIENTLKMVEKMSALMTPDGSELPPPTAESKAQTRKLIEESSFTKDVKLTEHLADDQLKQLTQERLNPLMLKQQEVKQETIDGALDNLGATFKNSMKDKDQKN